MATLVVLLVAGCGEINGDSADAAAGSGDASSGDGGGFDSGSAAVDAARPDAVPIICNGTDESFPEFDRSCTAARDCIVAVHQTDCCGNKQAWGINHSEADRFDQAELACRSMYPQCGCPQGPIVTDDGSTTWFEKQIYVACVDDACLTYVPFDKGMP